MTDWPAAVVSVAVILVAGYLIGKLIDWGRD